MNKILKNELVTSLHLKKQLNPCKHWKVGVNFGQNTLQ
jgi:hypothetical protein